jgi:hypothetical protein
MFVTILLTACCVVGSIVLHLYVLRLLWRLARRHLDAMSGFGIALLVLGCVVGHILEITLFTVGMFFVAAQDDNVKLVMEGMQHEHLDLWYISAAFYTSLGDKRPLTTGLRLFSACETLTGLILITWTASFLFLLMQRSWSKGMATEH